jgi:hypothetical protein
MKKFLAVAALAALIATPAFATTAHHHQALHHRAPQTTRQLYLFAPGLAPGAPGIADPGREAAMRACSAVAQRWSNSSWETTQFATYGTCMAAHGQMQ